jgi:hypothetical protein
MAEDGRLAFLAQQDTGFARSIILAEPGLPIRSVLNQGQKIGQNGEITVGLFEAPRINTAAVDSTLVLVTSSVSGFRGDPSQVSALISAGSSPKVLLIEGGTTQGLPQGVTIAAMGGAEIQPDDTSLVTLRITGPDINAFNDEGIYSMTPDGEVAQLISEGAELINLPGVYLGRYDGRASSFGRASAVDGGFILMSKLHGETISQFGDDEGIVFVNHAGIATLLAMEADPLVPGDGFEHLRDIQVRNFLPLGSGVTATGLVAFGNRDGVYLIQVPEPNASACVIAFVAIGILVRRPGRSASFDPTQHSRAANRCV